jgi:dolichol-phosphate mannosyltransferase
VLVVIPTFNEASTLPTLVSQILDLGPEYRVLVVDDNSPDGTGLLADQLAADQPGRVEVLHRPAKAGIGGAYRAGFGRALASDVPLIAQMDADGSHRPADLPRLVQATAEADVVLGSRYVAGGATVGWPRWRKLVSRAGSHYSRLVLGYELHDLTGGFKVFRRDALSGIEPSHITSDGYVFQIETTHRALRRGCRVVEVPITFHDRVAGRSKLSRGIVLEAVVVVWRLRFQKG